MANYNLIQLGKTQTDTDKKAPAGVVISHLLKLKGSYSALFPFTLKVAEYLLAIPVSNAWPERGASKVKLIKTRLRSRMTNKMLNSLLQITFNGPKLHTDECKQFISAAVNNWLAAKKRRKLPAPKAAPKAAPKRQTESAGVFQDRPEGLDEVHDEVLEFPVDLGVEPQEVLDVDAEVEAAVLALAIECDSEISEDDAESDYFSGSDTDMF